MRKELRVVLTKFENGPFFRLNRLEWFFKALLSVRFRRHLSPHYLFKFRRIRCLFGLLALDWPCYRSSLAARLGKWIDRLV